MRSTLEDSLEWRENEQQQNGHTMRPFVHINKPKYRLLQRMSVVYAAIYDYEAQTPEELSIRTGDLLVLNATDAPQDDPDWAQVTLRSQDAFVEQLSGLVPRTYIEPVSSIFHFFKYKSLQETIIRLYSVQLRVRVGQWRGRFARFYGLMDFKEHPVLVDSSMSQNRKLYILLFQIWTCWIGQKTSISGAPKSRANSRFF